MAIKEQVSGRRIMAIYVAFTFLMIVSDREVGRRNTVPHANSVIKETIRMWYLRLYYLFQK